MALQTGIELEPGEPEEGGRPRLVAVRGAQVVENGGSLEVLDRVGRRDGGNNRVRDGQGGGG